MTENSLITLYCIVDDFIHRFLETFAGKKNLALYYGKRRPKGRMPVADVVTLNLVRGFARTACSMLTQLRFLYVKTAIFRPIKLQKVSQAEVNPQKAGSTASSCMASALMTALWSGSASVPGREHDSRAFADITEGLEGIFVADAGYLLRQADLKKNV